MFGFPAHATGLGGRRSLRGFVHRRDGRSRDNSGRGPAAWTGTLGTLAATNHAFVFYDPAYAYEIRIMADERNACTATATRRRAITVYNEAVHQPAEPENAVEEPSEYRPH